MRKTPRTAKAAKQQNIGCVSPRVVTNNEQRVINETDMKADIS